MALSGLPKYLVIDDFLPTAMHADVLAYTLENKDGFEPTTIMRKDEPHVVPDFRQSLQCAKGLGPHKAAFRTVVHARCEEFFAAIGVPAFAIASLELQLIVHGDKAFYRSHIDTHIGPGHMIEPDYRVVSCVYYFHRQPKRFTGGEIVLFGLGESEDVAVIEPSNNRLVVFPSFVRHEVREISCPSGDFADSRFAINCWLRKQKRTPQTGQDG